MALADPQSVTIATVAKSMARVLVNGTAATYANADETWKLMISHSTSKGRTRSMVKLVQRKVVTNPLDSTEQDYDELILHFVLDRPQYGFSIQEAKDIAAGLWTWADATAVGKIYGKES